MGIIRGIINAFTLEDEQLQQHHQPHESRRMSAAVIQSGFITHILDPQPTRLLADYKQKTESNSDGDVKVEILPSEIAAVLKPGMAATMILDVMEVRMWSQYGKLAPRFDY